MSFLFDDDLLRNQAIGIKQREKLKKKPRQSIIDFADHAVKLADDFKKLMDMFVDLQREQENAKRK
ncbi:MAG: hypothetical protein K1X72_28545 [Pyrinomonadaceae bacterium]|nr:hypothetical protein [Pyrinomonadaceae bacterium]